MNTEKIEANSIYEMQKEILKSIKQIPDEIAATLQQQQEIDWSVLETMLNENAQKPQKVKHLHTHTISIQSSRVFILMVVLCLMVLGLLYGMVRQRDTISQYKSNDLKYRYIYMKGEVDGAGITRIERQFQYGDSVQMVRKQVEEYEKLVREQAEKAARARRIAQENERLKNEIEQAKRNK
jgi:uncharacterized protein YdcH (DUF465 family)